MNLQPGQNVEVKLENRLQEDYKAPPKKPVKAFSGAGNRLGSIVPGETSAATDMPQASKPAVKLVSVDESLPVTSIQVRLGDGTRLVARFNHTHTVADLYSFVQSYCILDLDHVVILVILFCKLQCRAKLLKINP
jgi:UBX domain-containing protein 1